MTREQQPIEAERMREWLSGPEWAYLVAFLTESCNDAMDALTSADPNDTAAVARAQTEVRFLRFFTSGEVADALKNSLSEQRKTRTTER